MLAELCLFSLQPFRALSCLFVAISFRGFARDRTLPRGAGGTAPSPAPRHAATLEVPDNRRGALGDRAPPCLASRHAATQGAPANRRGALGDRAPPRFATCYHARGSSQSTRRARRSRPTLLRMSLPRRLRGTRIMIHEVSRSIHQGGATPSRRAAFGCAPRTRHAGEARSPSEPHSGAPRAAATPVGRDLRASRIRVRPARPPRSGRGVPAACGLRRERRSYRLTHTLSDRPQPDRRRQGLRLGLGLGLGLGLRLRLGLGLRCRRAITNRKSQI